MHATDIETQFNPRRAVPNVDEHAARTQLLSQQARQRHEGIYNLRYGPGPLATLDVFKAAQDHAPVHVFLHGGYWRGRDKSDFSYLADALLPHGITTVVMNYDLCPAVTVAQIVDQTRRGLQWVAQQAAAWGVDGNKILVSGHSAGAHIIAATLAQTGADFQLKQHAIKKAYLISGVFDVEPVLEISVNEEVHLKPADVLALSPVRHPFAANVDYEVVVGGAEPRDWIGESTRMAAHLKSMGCRVGLHELPGLNHYSVLHEMDSPAGYISKLVARDLKTL